MSRRVINDKHTLDDGYGYVAYVADSLTLAGDDGDKDCASIAEQLEPLLTRNDALVTERRSKQRGVGRGNALVRRRDRGLDEVTQALHDDSLGLAKQDRQAPFYKRLWKSAVSGIIKLALESQLPVMRHVATALAEPEIPAALRKAHQKPLADAIDLGDKALAARIEAFADQGRTSARVQSWRDDANAALLGVEGALKALASERGLGAEWAESFFPPAERARAKSATKGESPPAADGA